MGKKGCPPLNLKKNQIIICPHLKNFKNNLLLSVPTIFSNPNKGPESIAFVVYQRLYDFGFIHFDLHREKCNKFFTDAASM